MEKRVELGKRKYIIYNQDRVRKENLCTDETTECKRGKLTSINAILIQMSNVYLNRRMIF